MTEKKKKLKAPEKPKKPEQVEKAKTNEPLVPGYRDKTIVYPLAKLQNWSEQQFKAISSQMQQTSQAIFGVIQNINKEVLNLKTQNLMLEIKNEALQELLKVDSKKLDDTIEKITKEKEIALEKEQDKRSNRSIVERPVKEHDIVKVDFKGLIDGKPFKGGEGRGYHVTVGSKTHVKGFEEALVGMSADETKNFNLTFPDDYQNKELAGKKAEFEITVKAVKEVNKSGKEKDEQHK